MAMHPFCGAGGGDPVLSLLIHMEWLIFPEIPETPEIMANQGGISVQSSSIPQVR